jgi:hypothetical protein
MKRALKLLLFLVIAAILGVGSAAWMMVHSSTVRNGPWETDLAIGSSQAGMYLRAKVAAFGLFALNRSESIYFYSSTDQNGQALRSNCDYGVEGRDLDARWWSITVYGQDQFLIPNEWNAYSFQKGNTAREADGSYRIHLSRTRKQGNWLPTGDRDQRLSLVLRLYGPGRPFLDRPEAVALPQIIREACR